jgi:hypothetical protein
LRPQIAALTGCGSSHLQKKRPQRCREEQKKGQRGQGTKGQKSARIIP